jgi:hypothetical protein
MIPECSEVLAKEWDGGYEEGSNESGGSDETGRSHIKTVRTRERRLMRESRGGG